jgi:tetratricopeptide (TPR) repeat protein
MPRGKWLLDGRASRWHRSVSGQRWVAGCFISLGLVGSAVAEEAPTAVDSAADDAASAVPSSALARASAETRRLLTQGRARYTAGDYATALDLFQRAYATAQNPAILFNIGATYAAMRQCRSARDTYHRYIEQTGSESGRADARRLLERLGDCDAEPSSAPVPHPPEAPQSQPAAAPSDAAEDVPAASPQHRASGAPARTSDQRNLDGGPSGARVAGWVALGSGGVMLLGSLGFAYASWRADDSEPGAAPGLTGDEAAREQAEGRRYNSLAWGLAGGSVALMSSGLLILMLDSKPQTSVRVASPQAGLGLRLSFDHRF